MSFSIRSLHDGQKEARLPRLLRSAKKLPWSRVLALGLTVGKPLLELGLRLHERQQRRAHFKRALSIGVSIVMALAVVLVALSIIIKIAGVSGGTLARTSGAPVEATEQGTTNVLILGQGDETGQDLIDAIMVLSIDPLHTKSVMALSLPRDLYFLHTDVSETKNGKLNALWRDNTLKLMSKGVERAEAATEAMRMLADEISTALGVPVHHVVKVDFTAFAEVVDAMGGIELDVPEEIHDTQYPNGNYGYETFHIDAGTHTLDGPTALKYVRSRSTTSDFDRSARQQIVLRAAAEKMRNSGLLNKPHKLLELYAILREHIQTDLSTRQIITLAGFTRSLEREHFRSLQLNDVNGLYGEPQWKAGVLYAPPRELFDGFSVLLPVSIPEFPVTWKQVQHLAQIFFVQRIPHLSSPRIAVLNGGAVEQSAGRVGRELTKFGFDVVNMSNTPGHKRDIETSFISGTNPSAQFFAELLQMPLKELPKEMHQTEIGDVTIVLGKEYSFTHFQDLPLP